MQKSDWIGLATSLGFHALLLVAFAFMTAMKPQPRPLGFIEVEFGDFARGRPVQAAPEETQAEAEPAETTPTTPPETEPNEEPPAEEQTQPVDVPDQEAEVTDEENVPPPDEEKIPPQTEDEPVKKEQQEENTSTNSSGADEGDPGEGTTEQKTAPYNIEGLNRDPLFSPLPRYAEKVDATIRVRITVDPRGRIVQRVPLLKGSPELEQAVMEALQRWRFNALPPGVPQENQTGVITFRFRLE